MVGLFPLAVLSVLIGLPAALSLIWGVHWILCAHAEARRRKDLWAFITSLPDPESTGKQRTQTTVSR